MPKGEAKREIQRLTLRSEEAHTRVEEAES
jgi:hypothetical protein